MSANTEILSLNTHQLARLKIAVIILNYLYGYNLSLPKMEGINFVSILGCPQGSPQGLKYESAQPLWYNHSPRNKHLKFKHLHKHEFIPKK